MYSIVATRGQTFANIAQQYYGNADYVAKLLSDNKLSYSSNINEGDKLIIDETFNGNLTIRNELKRFNFDPSNSNKNSNFRKIINKTVGNPSLFFDGIGKYAIDNRIFEIVDYNNVGRFSAGTNFIELDFRDFHLSKMQIENVTNEIESINFGEFPELENIIVNNSPSLIIEISENHGRQLNIMLNSCKYVDFSNINVFYDNIILSIQNTLKASKNDYFVEVLANKSIICGGTKKITLNGLTTPRGKLALDSLFLQGWDVTATGWEIPN